MEQTGRSDGSSGVSGDAGGSSNVGSSSVLPQEKGSSNKRKFVAPFLQRPVNLPSLLENCQKPSTHSGSLGVGINESKVVEPESDWDDPVTRQLEASVLSNLHSIFGNAIMQIVKCGYREDIALKAISRETVYCGGKDLVSDIVKDTLKFLRKGIRTGFRDPVFEDLKTLVGFTMVEMVGVLKEVKPSLSTADATWWLLICDLDISQACEAEDFFSVSSYEGVSRATSSIAPSKTNPKASNTATHDAQSHKSVALKFGSFPSGLSDPKQTVSATEHGPIPSQSSSSEDKSKSGHKGRNKKDNALKTKSIHVEKNNKHHNKSTQRSGTIVNISGFLMDKKMQAPTSKVPVAKGSASKEKAIAEVMTADQTIHTNNPPAVSVTSKSSNPEYLVSTEKKRPLKPDSKGTVYPELSYYYNAIPYDETLGKNMPRDEKDEQILKLLPGVQELQNELKYWDEWANQKVMQATRRLNVDKAELKALRKEKEEAQNFKKDMKIMEENTLKRLSEMQAALENTTNQVEEADLTVLRLQVEQAHLKNHAEAAILNALEWERKCAEALATEQKILKNSQSWEGERCLLLEELGADKQVVAESEKVFSNAKNILNRTEAKLSREIEEKESLLALAATIRSEREQIEDAAKAEEEALKQQKVIDMKKYEEDIKKLEEEISALKLKQDASKIAALNMGINGSLPSNDMFNKLAGFKDDVGSGHLRRDWECIMCLSEVKSVVFLPCAHQVLCSDCSELHEKRGMKECPSCRTPIKKRIVTCFK